MRASCFIIFLFFTTTDFAQKSVSGIVVDSENDTPVSFASISFEKGEGVITDLTGKFSLSVRTSRLNDSISISAIGFESLKMTLKELTEINPIRLHRLIKELEQVTIISSLKGDSKKFGYFRSWETINNNGEIGYIFDLPYTYFSLGAVQVKINHNYDTCRLKLHVREVTSTEPWLPSTELLKNDVIIPVTTKFGLVEFEIDWLPIAILNRKLYVGFELLSCGHSESAAPSFFFMGDREGLNLFKESKDAKWQKGGDYTIYVNLKIKQD